MVVPRQDVGLNGRPQSDDLLRVQLAVGFSREGLCHNPAHHWHPCGASHKEDLINFLRCETGILQSLEAGANGFLNEVAHKSLKFFPCKEPAVVEVAP